eukprot:1111404_1
MCLCNNGVGGVEYSENNDDLGEILMVNEVEAVDLEDVVTIEDVVVVIGVMVVVVDVVVEVIVEVLVVIDNHVIMILNQMENAIANMNLDLLLIMHLLSIIQPVNTVQFLQK